MFSASNNISALYQFDKLSAKATTKSKALKKKTQLAYSAKDLQSPVCYFLDWIRFHEKEAATLSIPTLHILNEHLSDLLGTIYLRQQELASHLRNYKRLALNKLFYRGDDLDQVMVQLQEEKKESREILSALDQKGTALTKAIKKMVVD